MGIMHFSFFPVFLNRLKCFFSGRKISVAIIITAILSRALQQVFFYTIGFDISYQVIATHNLVTGHGISTATADPAHLSATVYETLINWPPGYSILQAPFYIITGQNYILTGLLIEISLAIVLIFFSRKILQLLSLPLYLINIFTLINGFFIYHFYFISSTDSLAVSLYLIALYYTLLLLKHNPLSFFSIITVSISLFICAFLKYLFAPLVFVIPLFLFIKGRVEKKMTLKKSAVYIGTILFLLTGSLLLWQKFNSGSIAYISEPGRGLFPGNLLSAYPFISGSFTRWDSIPAFFTAHNSAKTLFKIIFSGVDILLVLFLFNRFLKKRQPYFGAVSTLPKSFLQLTFLVSLITLFTLATLSLFVYKEEIMPGVLWTYIQEPRYYGLAAILIQLSFITCVQYYKQVKSRLSRLLFFFLGFLLFTETARGIVFDANRIFRFNKETYYWQKELKFQQYADAIINREKGKTAWGNIVVTGSSPYMNNRVAVYSHTPLLKDICSINNLASFHTEKNVLLIAIIYKDDFEKFRSFLTSREVRLAGSYNEYYFYSVKVFPALQ